MAQVKSNVITRYPNQSSGITTPSNGHNLRKLYMSSTYSRRGPKSPN